MLIDTPGVGDKDVTPMKLVALIEDRLASNSKLQGVIVTSPVSDGRVKLGAQVVQALVDKGFTGGDAKWQNIVLTGTKKDRAQDGDEDFFRNDIGSEFFADTGTPGPVALTSVNDCEELWRALEGLAHNYVQYSKPDCTEIASAIAERVGIDQDLFKRELLEEREKAKAEQKRMETEFRTSLHEQEKKFREQFRAQEEECQRAIAEQKRRETEIRTSLHEQEKQMQQIVEREQALEAQVAQGNSNILGYAAGAALVGVALVAEAPVLMVAGAAAGVAASAGAVVAAFD